MTILAHWLPGSREQAAGLARHAMEAVVLVLVVLSPWAFGAVHARFEFWLFAGLALLLLLAAAQALLSGRWIWKPCPVALTLAGLLLFSLVQLLPWPGGLLGSLSPRTEALHRLLLPAEQEELPGGQPRTRPTRPAGSALSLYPGATQRETVKLLAVFLLFVIVQNQLASSACLWRLSVVALANGAALAVFALAHFLSAPAQTLYWDYATAGTPFGPFICRSHFAFYLNLCVGLGLGLLLSRQAGPPTEDEELGSFPAARPGFFAQLLHDPASLWISAALVLMVTASVFSLSRGGTLSLLAGALLVLLLQPARFRDAGLRALLACIACAALGLLSWFGLTALEDRLATLWTGAAYQSRLESWRHVLPLARDFPLWGTGLGTYQYVERLTRAPGDAPGGIWDHAHNEYVEALIEGGLVRLALSLVAIVLVWRAALVTIRRHAGRRTAALALGALSAFTMAVLHSWGEFGLHVPAITWLTVVIVAMLCGLDRPRPEAAAPPEAGGGGSALGGWVLWPGAVLAALLAVLLYQEGNRRRQAEHYRLAGQLLAQSTDPSVRPRQHDYLAAAAAWVPEDAELQLLCAEARFRQYQDERGQKEHLTAALNHYLAARDLCPLLVLPHLRLAALADELPGGEPRTAYLARAKLLHPADPEVWYLAGAVELAAGQQTEAWRSWQRCLEGSPAHLQEILRQCQPHLSPEAIRDQVLPRDPRLLLRAARELYPSAESVDERRVFLVKALELLGGAAPAGESAHLQAEIHLALGEVEQACQAFRAALRQVPDQVSWRFELAEALVRAGRPREARDELLIVLSLQPSHSEARSLLGKLTQSRLD